MMFPEGAMWHDGSLYVAAPPSIWKLTDTDGDGVADQRERVVPGQDADRLRQRPARPLPRSRRLDLLVQGGVRQSRPTTVPGQGAAVRHPGRAHLPLPARRHRHRAGDDRRHGQPRRCRLHARRRTHLHHDVLPAPRRRPARRPDSRRLRRRLWQGPRRHLRPPVDRPDADAGADPPRPGRAVRPDALRVATCSARSIRTTCSPACSTCTR